MTVFVYGKEFFTPVSTYHEDSLVFTIFSDIINKNKIKSVKNKPLIEKSNNLAWWAVAARNSPHISSGTL
jgi:hypothetical protein